MNRLLALYQTLLEWHEAIALAHETNQMALPPAAQTEMNAYARVLHHLDEVLATDFIALQHHFEPAPTCAVSVATHSTPMEALASSQA